MGNKGSIPLLFRNEENELGTCLIASIQTGTTIQCIQSNYHLPLNCSTSLLLTRLFTGTLKPVQTSLDTARKEFVAFKQSKLAHSNDENYKKMLDGLHLYLTRKYDVGEGTMNKKTPIELATKVGSIEIVDFLQNQINEIQRKLNVLSTAGSSGVPGGMEKIDTDRVVLAKARLEAFRATAAAKK